MVQPNVAVDSLREEHVPEGAREDIEVQALDLRHG